MSGIAAVPPARSRSPIEERQPPERDGKDRSPPRRPRKPRSEDELVEVEPHKLDLEA